MDDKPALCVIGTPGKRRAVLDLAAQADRGGYPALVVAGLYPAMAMCASLVHVTSSAEVRVGIQPIYLQNALAMAVDAGHLAEVSGGRFVLGLGVSHAAVLDRAGVHTGRPLADVRAYVDGVRARRRVAGPLPPIILATLRDRMLDLAVEIADGAVWANASFNHMPTQLARIPAERHQSFALSCMLPTVIDTDRAAARVVQRQTLTMYAGLPNYRNYWKAAGYEEEMTAIEAALAAGERDRLPSLMSDRWVDDCTVSGSVDQVRARFAEWYALGVQPVAVMSSTSGGQGRAIQELFEAFA